MILQGLFLKAYRAHRRKIRNWQDGSPVCVAFEGDGTLHIDYESGRSWTYIHSKYEGWYWYQ